jgi:hypothetical protein
MLARSRTNHLVLLDLPADAVGRYYDVRLTGTTGSTFTGAVSRPNWRSCDPQSGRGHVLRLVRGAARALPRFLRCEVCRDDTMVYALNRVPARYVSSPTGSVVTEINLEKEQSRAPIDVAMMEALRKISRAAMRQEGRSPS